MSFKDAASYLCVSTSKLYKMTHKREIPFLKMGRLNVFKQNELDDFIESQRVFSKSYLENMVDNNISVLYKNSRNLLPNLKTINHD